MKRIPQLTILLLCLILLTGLFVGCNDQATDSNDDPIDVEGITYVDTASVTNYVKIVFEKFGTVLVRLSPEDAPITVANFQKLVLSGFYNGLTIHRVEKNFVIQGGDPKGDGTGGSGETIKGEFAANGIVNKLSHRRGVLSMARLSNNFDSATSQFFICLDTEKCTRSLDGGYASFGWVIKGMDVVDRIAGVETVSNGYTNSPKQKITITSMSFMKPEDQGESTDAVTEPTTDAMTEPPLDSFTEAQAPTDYVKIEFEDFGTVVVQLSPKHAPITVANFKKLVGQGFYDGLTIHRVEKSFVIQGGDPKGDGTGGSGETIKGEFAANGVTNELSHKRGVISMARLSNNFDSATSQFFICLDTEKCTRSLDGGYASFGWVLTGMDVIDQIASVETVSNGYTNSPKETVTITKMSFVTLAEDAESEEASQETASETVGGEDTSPESAA